MESLRKHKGTNGRWIKVWMTVLLAWSVAVPAARPVSATGAGNIQKISVGQYYSMALTNNGKVLAWGNNNFEQTNVPIGLSDVQDIAAGYTHGAALTAGGGIVTWGAKGISSAPNLNVPANLTDVKAIDAGDSFTLALKNNGTVAAWSIINDPINANLRDPYKIETPPGDAVGITKISAGKGHALALRSDGRVVAWGSTSEGASNNQGQSIVPDEAKSGIIAIAAGGYHSLALTNGGEVIAWGAGSDNNGLNHDFGQTIVPPAAKSDVIAIAAGRYHSLALKTDGTVIAWGSNGFGQSTVPQGLTDVDAIAAGDDTSLVLKQDGAVEGWGYNGYGGAVINGDLSGLTVQEGTLNPAFSPSQLSYEVAYVGASTTSVNVKATLVDAKNGILYIDNKPQTSGSFAAVNLSGLKTVIPVSVEHPIYQPKYYEIAVFRDNTFPTVQFSPNGSGSTPMKSASTQVAVEDTISGVDHDSLQYVWTQSASAPASGWNIFNASVPLTKADEDGQWYLHVRGKDRAGNWTTETSNPFLIDQMPPVIDITMKTADNAPYSDNNWTNQNVIVSAEVTDASVTAVTYSTNSGTTWYPYTAPFQLQAEGVHPVTIKAVDSAGNENTAARTVKISKSGLELTPTMKKAADDSDYTSGEWTNSDVHVTAKAEWGVSGLQALTYALNGAAEQNYSNESLIPFTASGMHTIAFKLTDHAGNSLSAPLAVNIDKTAPTADWSENGREAWSRTARTVVTISDTGGSDIVDATLKYAWTTEATAPTSGWIPFDNGAELIKADGDGDWYLHLEAQDRADNALAAAAAVSNRFRLDNTGPAVNLDVWTADNEPYIDGSWTNQDVTVAASATDGNSGVQSLSYALDGGTAWEDYTTPIVLQEDGVYDVAIKAVDMLGNETIKHRTVKIGQLGPAMTPTMKKADDSDYVNGEWTNGDVTVSVEATGGVSELDTLTYQLDAGSPETYTTGTPISFNGAGTYMLLFKARNKAGNESSIPLTVNIDKTAPVIALNGSSSMNVTQGRAYVEAGATATDVGGSGVAGEVVVTGTVNTNVVGTYTLQYHVSDLAGNAAAEVVRTVRVVSPSGGGSGSTPEPIATNPPIDLNGVSLDPADIDISKPSVTLEVVPKNGTAYVSIPVSILTGLEGRNATFYIEIKTPYGSYQIPVNLSSLIPGLKELLAKNNLQAEDIGFKITLTDKSGDKVLQAALADGLPKGKVMGAMVDYHLEVVNIETGETIGTADQFSQAITRIIPMPKNVTAMPEQWGAFRYNGTTKKFEFVPAKAVKLDGVWYAMISSYSNSTYVVAENAVSFADVQKKHWAKSYVELAAAKGLVEGVGGERYDPDKAVTRAEFTVMLVRALGRGTSSGGNAPAYSDVGVGTWYSSAVAAAKAFGLLSFAKGSSFKPNQTLTREEMASMLAAAIRLERPTITSNGESLGNYKDIGSLDTSDLENIRLVTKLQIMNGTSKTMFSPAGATTRAQAAAVFVRTLQALDSIDELD